MAVSHSTSPPGSSPNPYKAFDTTHPGLAKTGPSRSLEDFDFAKSSESQPLDNEGKEEAKSGSCCLSSCIHRIYDFVCSLFRCLFCMKQKVKEPGLNTSLPKKVDPKEAARLQAAKFYISHVQNLKDSLKDFKNLDSKVQNYILSLITISKKYEDLALYLDEGLGPQKKKAFETNYEGPFLIATADANQEKLEAIFRKDF